MLDLWKRLVSWRKLISLKKENDISTLKRIDVLDTHLDSDNLGDEIINYYCYNILKELNIDIDKKVLRSQYYEYHPEFSKDCFYSENVDPKY